MKKMVCNLWFIKKPNGLFYYSVDYIREMRQPCLILVRKQLLMEAKSHFPMHQVESASIFLFIYRIIRCFCSKNFVYTPTSHPIPFLNNQIIIIHDDYPFRNWVGKLKKFALLFSLRTSKCIVGHINHSTSLEVLPQNFNSSRLVYAPNFAPNAVDVQKLRTSRVAFRQQPKFKKVISFFGTDSEKKRYEIFFNAARKYLDLTNVYYEIYGNETEYFEIIKEKFSDFDIQLINSSVISLEESLQNSTAIVSVAESEGFGRPLALGFAAQIECFLIHCEVFEEFYGEYNCLYRDIDNLILALRDYLFGINFDVSEYDSEIEFNHFSKLKADSEWAVRRIESLLPRG